MTSAFELKNIFNDDFCKSLCNSYGFNKDSETEISKDLQNTFRDFIILILSENNSYTLDERNKLYNEAIYNYSIQASYLRVCLIQQAQ